MSAVAIIPARGGSRRIPRKNIKLFHGKPIIAYSIEAAKENGLFDIVAVSTDSQEIAEIAAEYGAFVHRRLPHLAEDSVGTQAVMQAVLVEYAYLDYACCVYPCAPMMTARDLRLGFQALISPFSHVFYYFVPGWFYWGRIATFLSGEPLDGHMESITDERYIDINTPEDWTKAEAMYAALHPEVA